MTQKVAPYFIVEGNIGAGKSTFLRLIQEKLGIEVVYEPTDKWQRKDKDGNLLDLFYKDTSRWAYTFQSYAFITRVQAQVEHEQKATTGSPQVYERSVYCDRYCFAKNCFEMGAMSELEWTIYKEWFSWLVESYTRKPSGFVYLQTTPEKCFERIQKRARCEESSVPLSYLQSLHDRHEEWLIEKKEILPSLQSTPVLTLDCNEEFETHPEIQASHLAQLKAFVDSLEATEPMMTPVHSAESAARLP
jgi:deoxyadenosine/deoxycytidine kinase